MVLVPCGVAEQDACAQRAVGQADEVLVNSRVEGAEQRQNLLAHTHAEMPPIEVRGIARETKAAPHGVLFDLGTMRSNQGTKKVLGRGREHGKSLDGSAAQNSDHYGLGAVLEMMPCRDKRGRQGR